MSERPRRVVILGAGITGLCAAYELVERAKRERRGVEISVLEASNRIGGKVASESREGAVLEGGPDSFITSKPDALALVKELGLSGELLKTNPDHKTIFVLSGGRLIPLPNGVNLVPTRILPFLTSELISWKGKLRMGLEWFIGPENGGQDESLGDFTRRRLGQEALDKIVGPMLGGIYAGDPDRMSLESTFPQLKDMERRGGLMRSMWSSPARAASTETTLFMTLKGGLGRLIEALALRLPAQTVRTGASVAVLRRRGSQWEIGTRAGEKIMADSVISALPANALAETVEDLDPELAAVLREIPFVSTATASFVYDAAGFPDPLDGFGFLVPRSEGKQVTAATYTSTKFPGRAPAGQVLIRCFLGGAGREEAAEGDDALAARAARNELRDILKLGERHPRATKVTRWVKANPQYTVGHALRLRRIESCLQGHPGLILAGCSYKGVGLPDCVRSGRQAASAALRAASGRPAEAIA